MTVGRTRDKCIVCGGETFIPLVTKGQEFVTEQSVVCDGCGLIFIQNYRVDEDYYISGDFDKELRHFPVISHDRMQRSLNRFEHMKQFLEPRTRYCDVGCGYGELIDLATNHINAENVTGFEPSPNAFHYCEFKGHRNLVKGYFDPALIEEQDLISVIHVFEHVEHPIEWISSVVSKLSQDGTLILEYPDFSRAARRKILGNTYFQKSHLFDFSLVHVLHILANIGFVMHSIVTWTGFGVDKNVLCVFQRSDDIDRSKIVLSEIRDIVFNSLRRHGKFG